MKSILETLQAEFEVNLALTQNSILRDYKFPKAKNIIKVAIGMRRSGKTFFLFQTARELLKEKFPLQRILYINFEDDRILPLDSKGMGQLIDSWYTLYPHNHDHLCYLFLDEVQNVTGWQVVLRRILDTKNVQIYATGSSAKLLSKEIATSLRGRSLAIEILPYNYLEFLSAHNLTPPSSPYSRRTLDLQYDHLLNFFKIGGFPAVQKMPQNEHLETLQNYVETVIFRDVIERYQITSVPLLKYFIYFLLKSVGAPFSVNKFFNDVKSQGHKAAKETLHSYLKYLEDAFLIFTVPIFSESLRRIQTTPKKIYAIDNGLINANSFNLSSNYGKLFENQVYLDLRKQGRKIFYYKTTDGFEIDFVTQDLHGKHELLQVVWEKDDPQTMKREERALQQAEKELGFPGKIIDWTTYLKEFIMPREASF